MDPLVIALLLFVVGVMLGLAEVFVPSAGLLAILSVAAFVAAIVFAFKAGAAWGIGLLLAAPIVMIVVVVKGFSIFPRTGIGRKMILPKGREETPDSDQPSPSTIDDEPGEALVGQVGTARTELRPAGSAQIGDRRYQVVTLGDFISKGTAVRVVEVRGNRIVVEAVS